MRRALNFDERPELMHFEPGLFLRLVVELVGHGSQVVADASAHRNRDMLALTPLVALAPRRRARRHHRRRQKQRRRHQQTPETAVVDAAAEETTLPQRRRRKPLSTGKSARGNAGRAS